MESREKIRKAVKYLTYHCLPANESTNLYKYVMTAVSALEKQEPMKPLPQEMDVDGRAVTPCGFCGEELPGNPLYEFCPWCGQAIDRRKE